MAWHAYRLMARCTLPQGYIEPGQSVCFWHSTDSSLLKVLTVICSSEVSTVTTQEQAKLDSDKACLWQRTREVSAALYRSCAILGVLAFVPITSCSSLRHTLGESGVNLFQQFGRCFYVILCIFKLQKLLYYYLKFYFYYVVINYTFFVFIHT